jgi:predicted amidohydrolase
VSLTLASITMNTRSNKQENLATAEHLIRDAKAKGADWVLLPEIFAYFGDYATLHGAAEEENGPLNQKLSALAKELGIVLFAGSVGERSKEPALNDKNQRRVYNTNYVFDREGKTIAKYRKTHLFNLRDASGKKLYCESDGFIPGNEAPKSFVVDGYRVGMAICYDLRFPSLFQRLAKDAPLDVLVIPSAFTRKTGEAHWELLLRARAVELQCFVFAANQTGEHAPGKESFGHSMVIDPWGTKLADTGPNVGIAIAKISKDRLAEVRAQLPALKNQRPELYE